MRSLKVMSGVLFLMLIWIPRREVDADPGRRARHERRLSFSSSSARHGILPWRESRPPRRDSIPD
jgi:hypothetical protein